MDLSAAGLRQTEDSLPAIARSVGYSSVYAFSRTHGEPPGHYRSRYRGAPQAIA